MAAYPSSQPFNSPGSRRKRPPLVWLSVLALLAGLLRLSGQLSAQQSSNAPPPPAAPTPQNPIINSALQPSGGSPLMIFPETEAVPYAVVGATQPATQVALTMEGTYFHDRTGRFGPSPDGRYLLFYLDYNGYPTSDPPIRVLPSQERLRVEQSLVPNRDQRFIVTGLVTEYRNCNCILLQRTSPTWSLSRPLASMKQSTTGPIAGAGPIVPWVVTPAPPPPGPGHALSTAPASTVLDEMLASTAPPPPPPGPDVSLQPAPMANLPVPRHAPANCITGSASVAPWAPTLPLRRENTLVTDRLVRLDPTPDGQGEQIVFDSDGPALSDPPLIVLPNLALVSMESAVSAFNRDLRFRVSGTVTEYRGRNYILLDKAVIVLDPAQSFPGH